ncbi:hypothetical protein [Duganella sp. Leaf126]|uniref:hypothetical protein n=1 Tax=Duganella sp. Leaf126 TaxID=1736266 RepID=UPI0012E21F26|nr:hypothetical protein [Duganella sp. Leaf126]
MILKEKYGCLIYLHQEKNLMDQGLWSGLPRLRTKLSTQTVHTLLAERYCMVCLKFMLQQEFVTNQ